MGCLSGPIASAQKRAQSPVLAQLMNYKKNLDQKFILEQKLDQFDENKKRDFYFAEIWISIDFLASASWVDSHVE